jgi:DNA-binding cell septation regulator SpoVG
MKIANLKKLNGDSKVKAFFSVQTPKMDINDFKLVEGKDGKLYAMPPSKQYEHKGETKYSSIVYITDDSLRDKITELAREEYFRGQMPENDVTPDDDIPF